MDSPKSFGELASDTAQQALDATLLSYARAYPLMVLATAFARQAQDEALREMGVRP